VWPQRAAAGGVAGMTVFACPKCGRQVQVLAVKIAPVCTRCRCRMVPAGDVKRKGA
jgi:DNA-directed RNA polymerase subunit RPC12/RpoP